MDEHLVKGFSACFCLLSGEAVLAAVGNAKASAQGSVCVLQSGTARFGAYSVNA